jgi:hypothetical protein
MVEGKDKAVDSRQQEAVSAGTGWELSATRRKINYSGVQWNSVEKEQADIKFISFCWQWENKCSQAR